MNDLADILSRVAGLRVCVGTRCKCDAGHEWVSAHGDCVWFQMPHCPVCHKPATSQRGEWQTLAEHAAERPVTVIDPAKVPAEDLTKVLAEEFVKGVSMPSLSLAGKWIRPLAPLWLTAQKHTAEHRRRSSMHLRAGSSRHTGPRSGLSGACA